jgi:hypothetical protein
MKERKKTESIFRPFFNDAKQVERKAAVGKVGTFITKHIKSEEPTLFDEKEIADRDKAIALNPANAIFGYSGKKRFSNTEMRILYALCYGLTAEESADVTTFIDKAEKQKDIPTSQYVGRRINLKDLCHFVFGDRRAKNLKSLIRDIVGLGSIPIKWTYDITDESGSPQKWLKIAPLLIYDINIPIVEGNKPSIEEAINEIIEDGYIDVTFTRPFLQGIRNRFAYVPKALITQWGKKGTQSELFSYLLNEFLSIHGNYRKAAIDARKAAVIQARKDKLSAEQREALKSERVKRALTGNFLFSSIKASLETDYETERKGAKFEKQLRAAMDFFKNEIHLITEYQIVGVRKNKKLVFVFNYDYGKQAGALPEPDEATEE